MPSKSKAQHNLMEAAAHGATFPKAKKIPTKVAKEFAAADVGKFKNGGNIKPKRPTMKPRGRGLMNRTDTLKKADSLVNGDRANEYGPPRENFARIAKMWSVILNKDITLTQVSLCLIALKMTRLIQSEKHEDSFVDIAGYAACGNEIVTEPSLKHVESKPIHRQCYWCKDYITIDKNHSCGGKV